MLIRVQKIVRHLIVCALLAIVAPVCFAADSVGEPGRDSKGPNPLRNVYFGEQHLHTQNSPDAFVVNTRGTWEDAYNYAMGNEITLSTTGEKIRKTTPYDFVGITDHSEYFGVMPSLIDPDDPLYESELGKQMRDPNMNPSAPDSPINQILSSIITNVPMEQFVTPALQQANWARYIETANKFNQPGKFTTLIAYEWTSIPNGRNMHRNVYWRGDAPAAPFSSFDSIYPQDLWTYMEFNRNVGLESIAIPHNANVSDGWMFSHNTFLGGPMDARHAFRQQANEPVMEIIQTKGQSEAHPAMSPNDEFAEFEMFPNMINVAQPSQINYGYMRQGLAEGMILEEKLGTNPFKYGIVAGADSHSAYSNNEEWGFHGSHGVTDDTPAKRLAPGIQPSGDRGVGVGSAGATAVWAEENTREAIFDAMKRRETYGTSGPLMRVRFFGGWDFDGDLVEDDDFVEKAYEDGVPMGGDLPARPERARAPTFAVWAMKDPESGNLDRIQIIKVWLDARLGRSVEKIFDVALSDGRAADADGNVPPVGNTVDLSTAAYTNDIGDSQLSAVWTDPEFDPAGHAAYYVRVLEIPTPRWSTYDAVRNNLPISDVVPPTIQERAWSSPIWYTPASD